MFDDGSTQRSGCSTARGELNALESAQLYSVPFAICESPARMTLGSRNHALTHPASVSSATSQPS